MLNNILLCCLASATGQIIPQILKKISTNLLSSEDSNCHIIIVGLEMFVDVKFFILLVHTRPQNIICEIYYYYS